MAVCPDGLMEAFRAAPAARTLEAWKHSGPRATARGPDATREVFRAAPAARTLCDGHTNCVCLSVCLSVCLCVALTSPPPSVYTPEGLRTVGPEPVANSG